MNSLVQAQLVDTDISCSFFKKDSMSSGYFNDRSIWLSDLKVIK